MRRAKKKNGGFSARKEKGKVSIHRKNTGKKKLTQGKEKEQQEASGVAGGGGGLCATGNQRSSVWTKSKT